MAKKAKIMFLCKFGNVSIGDQSASIKATISRGNIELAVAEELFCGRLLKIKLTLLEGGESPDQKTLPGTERTELTATASFGKYSVGPKEVGAGMKFSLGEIDAEKLCHFAKQEGTLEVVKVMGTIADEEGSEDGTE